MAWPQLRCLFHLCDVYAYRHNHKFCNWKYSVKLTGSLNFWFIYCRCIIKEILILNLNFHKYDRLYIVITAMVCNPWTSHVCNSVRNQPNLCSLDWDLTIIVLWRTAVALLKDVHNLEITSATMLQKSWAKADVFSKEKLNRKSTWLIE